jgi:hypothetical protein
MSVSRAIDVEVDRSSSVSPTLGSWWTRRIFSALVTVPALLTLTACAGATPSAPSQPTVQAVATQAVGVAASGAATAQAGASPAAATAMAAASPAAATAQAAGATVAGTVQAGAPGAGATAASVVGTAVGAIPPLASPSPSPAAQVPLRIADASLADATPWLSIQNDSDTPVEVGGWSLEVGTAKAALPVDAVVPPGGALTIHAGDGMSSDDELFLGEAGDVLAQAAMPGTPVRLSDERGRVVTEVTVPRF